MRFDLDVVGARLLNEAYGRLAALPLLALAWVIIRLAWCFAGWLSRRTALVRVAWRNPFMRDLARTTLRWVVAALCLLVALEILDATALVGALLGTAGVLGVAIGFAFKDTLENCLAGILMNVASPSRHTTLSLSTATRVWWCRCPTRDNLDDTGWQPPAAAQLTGLSQRDGHARANLPHAIDRARVGARHAKDTGRGGTSGTDTAFCVAGCNAGPGRHRGLSTT